MARTAEVAKLSGAEMDTALVETGAKAEAAATTHAGAMKHISDSFASAEGRVKSFATTVGAAVAKVVAVGTLAGGAAAVASVKMAGNFQEAMTALVTGAGESADAIGQVQTAVLSLAGKVGSAPKQLADGLYPIESAGFHAADGLKVLQAAAEGAKVGSADMATVADAVTSALNAYHLGADKATAITDQLVTTVASGKMHMQDLAGSLSAVLPVAQAAGLSLAEVGGAIATMTAKGTSAEQASQNLANTIRTLQAPSQESISAMEQLGLNAAVVQQSLGKVGLTGTIDMLYQAVAEHMGPAGLVILDTMKKSQSATADANQMLQQMPPSLQAVAQQFQRGDITAKEWRHTMMGLPVTQKAMASQFAGLVTQINGYNDNLKAGTPANQTFAAALSKVMGNATAMNVALQVGGDSMATFRSNVDAISSAADRASDHVQGWDMVQRDFNTKLSQLRASVEAVAIRFGLWLIPKLEAAGAALYTAGVAVRGFISDLVSGFTKGTDAVGTAQSKAAQWGAALHLWFAERVLPAVHLLAQAFTEYLVPAFERVVGWMREAIAFMMRHKEILVGLVVGVGAAAVAFHLMALAAAEAAAAETVAFGPFIALGAIVAAAAAGIIYAYEHFQVFHRVVDDVARFVRSNLLPILAGVAAAVAVAVVPAFVAGAASAFTLAAGMLATAAAAAAPLVAVAALTAGVIYAYQHWTWFREAVDAVARFLTGKVLPAIRTVADFLATHWRGALLIAAAVILGPLGAALVFAMEHMEGTKRVVMDLWHAFMDAWHGIAAAVQVAWAVIKPIWDFWYGFFSEVLPPLLTGARVAFEVAFTSARVAVEVSFAAIHAAITAAWAVIGPIFDVWKRVMDTVIPIALGILHDAFFSLFHAIGDVVSWVWDHVLEPIFSKVEAGLKSAGNAGKDLGKLVTGHPGALLSDLHVPGFAAGAIVTKPTLAMIAEAGRPEAVVPLTSRFTPMVNIGVTSTPPSTTAAASAPTGTQVIMQPGAVQLLTKPATPQEVGQELAWSLRRV